MDDDLELAKHVMASAKTYFHDTQLDAMENNPIYIVTMMTNRLFSLENAIRDIRQANAKALVECPSKDNYVP